MLRCCADPSQDDAVLRCLAHMQFRSLQFPQDFGLTADANFGLVSGFVGCPPGSGMTCWMRRATVALLAAVNGPHPQCTERKFHEPARDRKSRLYHRALDRLRLRAVLRLSRIVRLGGVVRKIRRIEERTLSPNGRAWIRMAVRLSGQSGSAHDRVGT